MAKLASDVVASSGALFATKRKHFKAYKCISGTIKGFVKPNNLIEFADLLLYRIAVVFTLHAKIILIYTLLGAELVDCVCKILTVTRPRATDYCEQMRVKLHLFSFPDKKKPFRDDKNSYFAFKDTRQVDIIWIFVN